MHQNTNVSSLMQRKQRNKNTDQMHYNVMIVSKYVKLKQLTIIFTNFSPTGGEGEILTIIIILYYFRKNKNFHNNKKSHNITKLCVKQLY